MTKSGCIELDRTRPIGTKVITDSEINYYKFFGNDDVSDRFVALKRKAAIDSVKNLIYLYHFINFIRAQYGEHEKYCSKVTERVLLDCEEKYPLNIEELCFKTWMWYYVLDKDVLLEFNKTHGGDVCDITDILYQQDSESKKSISSYLKSYMKRGS